MERNQAKDEIRRNWETLIGDIAPQAKQKVYGKSSYICPICKHGTNGDGLNQVKDSEVLNCFGCNFKGDIIDLYMKAENMDYNSTLSLLARKLNIELDRYNSSNNAANSPRNDFKEYPYMNIPTNKEKSLESEIDHIEYYRACRERLTEPEAVAYLNSRGISQELAYKYFLGYDPEADPASSGHPTPRFIIPTTRSHYVARALSNDMEKKYRYMNSKGSTPGIFNINVLNVLDVQEVFVCEGAFDALSVMEIGGAAIGLNSTAQANKLIKHLETNLTDKIFIVCLDNDEAGKKAKETLIAGLRRLNVSYITANISKNYKDPNECLQKDKAGFIEAVEKARLQTASKPDNVEFYINNLMGTELEDFKCNVKTGFSNLDTITDGLYAGLYVLAAISSLGKTTFAHQMADQIAAAGTDVLYFSLEQSRLEMVTKSISRITGQTDLKKAVSSLSIRKGFKPPQVQEAAREYLKRVADRMNIIEGNFNCDISFIGDYIRRYIQQNNVKPVIFIDYLQILQPGQDKIGRQQSTKEMIDIVVPELKRLSREFGITVVVICSVNRKNYLLPIDYESLKESGIIEYTADVVWGLQLACISDPMFQKQKEAGQREAVKKAKESTPRELEFVCLKNRYGKSSYDCKFNYYPACDLFIPECTSESTSSKTVELKRL